MSAACLRKVALIALALTLADNAHAQVPDSARHFGTTVSGVVRDSIARAPLAGALVQLVASDDPAHFLRSARSDSLGRFTLFDVPPGSYRIGFFHPLLDSLGMDAPLRDVHVYNLDPVSTDLAVPSMQRIRRAVCGDREDGGIFLGVVRNARDGTPEKDVTVAAEWLEYSFAKKAVSRQTVSRVTTTAANGWFAMCGLPAGGAIAMIASRGADSTDILEIVMPADGFFRRELFLGPTRTVEARGRPGSPNTQAGRPIHLGDGRLSGTVVKASNGIPLADALVRVSGGPETRTNEFGEWSIINAPLGTRTLEIRALGYYPESRHVDIGGKPLPMEIGLSTVEEVLDTVMIRARRIYTRGDNGFADRKQTGVGRYLSADDIARRPSVFTSDIFKTMSGIRLGYASDTLATDMALAVNPDDMGPIDRRILMRGISGNWCAPSIYLDGTRMSELGAGEIDAWVRPNDVAAIEIYSEATVPAEFNDFRSGCGSIVIWRKDPFDGRTYPQR